MRLMPCVQLLTNLHALYKLPVAFRSMSARSQCQPCTQTCRCANAKHAMPCSIRNDRQPRMSPSSVSPTACVYPPGATRETNVQSPSPAPAQVPQCTVDRCQPVVVCTHVAAAVSLSKHCPRFTSRAHGQRSASHYPHGRTCARGPL